MSRITVIPASFCLSSSSSVALPFAHSLARSVETLNRIFFRFLQDEFLLLVLISIQAPANQPVERPGQGGKGKERISQAPELQSSQLRSSRQEAKNVSVVFYRRNSPCRCFVIPSDKYNFTIQQSTHPTIGQHKLTPLFIKRVENAAPPQLFGVHLQLGLVTCLCKELGLSLTSWFIPTTAAAVRPVRLL